MFLFSLRASKNIGIAASILKQVMIIRKLRRNRSKLSKDRSRNFENIFIEKSKESDLETKETFALVKCSKIKPDTKDPVNVRIPINRLYVPL